jgi:hypothetical protein
MSTAMMKSTLYRRHYRSKKKYPTRVIKGSTSKGGISIGHKKAQQDVEQKLGRKLNPGTKVRTAGGNWVFVEPLAPPAAEE